jgi:uncharacterized membrane protein
MAWLTMKENDMFRISIFSKSMLWRRNKKKMVGTAHPTRLRFAALMLFGITALKLVIVDMARVNQIYRIVSFLVLGLLMIGASYLYHRLEKRLDRLDKNKTL